MKRMGVRMTASSHQCHNMFTSESARSLLVDAGAHQVAARADVIVVGFLSVSRRVRTRPELPPPLPAAVPEPLAELLARFALPALLDRARDAAPLFELDGPALLRAPVALEPPPPLPPLPPPPLAPLGACAWMYGR